MDFGHPISAVIRCNSNGSTQEGIPVGDIHRFEKFLQFLCFKRPCFYGGRTLSAALINKSRKIKSVRIGGFKGFYLNKILSILDM